MIQATLAKAFRGELVPAELTLTETLAARNQQIQEGVAVLYALALLHTWQIPSERRVFELGLMLMQRDELRQRILKGRSFHSSNNPSQISSPSVGRIDEFIGELVGSETLSFKNLRTRQLISLGKNAPTQAAISKETIGAIAFEKAKEATRAVAMLNTLGQSIDQYASIEDYDPIEIAIS